MNSLITQAYQALMSDPNEENLGQVLDLLMEELFAERGCIWVDGEATPIYRGDEELRERFPFSTQVVEAAMTNGAGFVSFDSQQDDRLGPTSSIAVNSIRSCLGAAARDEAGKVLAIAYFDNKTSAGNFTEKDLALVDQVMALYPGAHLQA